MKELNKKIIGWAKERELDTKGTVKGQAIKTCEEIAELIIGISKDNLILIKDGIGDVYVTLVVGNLISKSGWDIDRRLKNNRFSPSYDKRYAIFQLSHRISEILNNFYSLYSLEDCLEVLKNICDLYDLTLKDCVESAYREIKNRKGKVIDGQFVKDVE